MIWSCSVDLLPIFEVHVLHMIHVNPIPPDQSADQHIQVKEDDQPDDDQVGLSQT